MHWVILIVFIPVPIVIPWLFVTACRRSLNKWAKDNSYELISAEGNMLQRGPYRWRISNHHMPLRFEVLDAHGVKKSGWALCSAFKVVDCTWDKEGADQETWACPMKLNRATLVLICFGIMIMMGLMIALVLGKCSVDGETPAWYPLAQGCFLVLAIGCTVTFMTIFARDGQKKVHEEGSN